MVDQDKSTIISVVLFGLSGFLSSFFFSGGMSVAYAPPLLFLAIGLALSWHKNIQVPLHSLVLFGFIFYSGISFFWSGAPYITLASWLVLLALPLSYFFGRSVYTSQASKKLCIYTLILIGGLATLYGGFHLIISDTDRLSALFSNPNTFSSLLILCLLPCASFLMSQEKKKILWACLSVFFIVAILLTGSRSGILTGIFALITLFYFSPVEGKVKYIALFLVTVFITGMISYFQGAHFFIRILNTFSEAQFASTQGRLTIWEGSVNLARDYIFTGTGLGTFFLNYPVYRLPKDPSVGDWAHFDSLQILSETGVFGLLLWLGFWCALLCSAIKYRRRLSSLAVTGLIACFCLFIQGFFTYLYLALPLLIIMGFYLALYDTELCGSAPLPCQPTFSQKYVILFVVLTLFLTAQSSLSMLTTKDAQENMFKANTARAKQQIALVEAFGSPYFYEHLMVLGKRGDLEALELAKTRCTPCADPYFVSGLIHLQKNQLRMAKQDIWNAMQKDPSDQNIRLHFVRILEQQGRLNEASIIAKQGLAYPIEPEQRLYFKEIILKSSKNQ